MPFLWLAGKRKNRKAAFLWQIDPDKCIQCGKCVEKCPAKVITPPAGTGA